ncbi:MAG: Holliday junction branch migration protein RuvA [Coriobacteriales bacterium]|nr:Holliday junction branch migration protein RuvA [Coriobacteriales bacterium]
MIVMLTGTLVEVTPSIVVLNVAGVGYELGVSALTASSLPSVGTPDVTLFTRLVVREGAIDLFGFGSRDERLLFDKLVSVSHVGPKLALAVLSTFSPTGLATVVTTGDTTRMATVPGVGKKTASRLVMELSDIFAKDPVLRGLASSSDATPAAVPAAGATGQVQVERDVTDALLSMGFTSQEAELALEGYEKAGAHTLEAALSYALKRLGKRR